jgi:eukaryotic-like serine/threonine-protein kinase
VLNGHIPMVPIPSPRARDGRAMRRILIDSCDLWIHEAERDLMKFTPVAENASSPVWTPDDERIIFAAAPGGSRSNLYWRRANGTAPVKRLTESANPQTPHSVDPSGKYLAFTEADLATRQDLDIKILPLAEDATGGLTPGTPYMLVGTSANENRPAFSTDGRWLAYVSTESGRPEVFVTSFPLGDKRRKVSGENGGDYPAWSKTQQELFYAVPGGRVTR